MMKINHTMFASNILTNLYSAKQNVKLKITFPDIVHKILIVKKFCRNIERYAYKWMLKKV